MARPIIELKYPAICEDCRAELEPGDRARLYRKRGRRGWVVYGVDCHEDPGRGQHTRGDCPICGGEGQLHGGRPCRRCDGTGTDLAKLKRERSAYDQGDRSPGAIASHYDRTGVYSADGRLIGRVNPKGRCEDAPCCGCCT